MKYCFYQNCVNWPNHDVHRDGGLTDLINDRIPISRRTFLKHVNRVELQRLESELSYEPHPKLGLTMAGDFHVEYFRSKHHGRRVYGFRHSAIEFVFAKRHD